jgi:hypothetical protein
MADSQTALSEGNCARGPVPFLRRLEEWLPEILLLTFTTGAAIWARGRWIDPVGDAGTWWSAAYRLSNGEVLYRDVFLQFGPLSPYLLALGARIVGASAPYMGIVSWISAIAAALLLLRAARPFLATLERVALVGLVLGISLFAPGPGRLVFAYAPAAVHALLLSCGALLLVRDGEARFKIRAWGTGLLAGLASCAKQEIGLACLVALAAATLIRRKHRIAWLVRAGLGFSLPVAVATAVAFSSSSLHSLREESRLWPLTPAPPASWLHLYSLVAGFSVVDWLGILLASLWRLLWYLDLFAVAALLIVRERKPSRWFPTAVLFLTLLVSWVLTGFRPVPDFHPISLSMVIAFFVAAAGVVQKRLPERSLLVALGCFAGFVGVRTAVSTQLSGHYSGVAHFASALTWAVFLCVVAPGIVQSSERGSAWMRRLTGIGLLLTAWVGAVTGARALAAEGKEAVETRQGTVFVDRAPASVFRVLARKLTPGERIWVLPEVNGVDALFLARSISPYPSQMPGWLDPAAEAKLTAAFEINPPETVVIFSRATSEYGVEEFGEGYARLLAAWVARNYSPIERMKAGTILGRNIEGARRASPNAARNRRRNPLSIGSE